MWKGIALLAMIVVSGCVVVDDPRQANIPPGHMPPPGQCRVWHPDRRPGHRPPPGPCEVLYFQAPPGAILVRG